MEIVPQLPAVMGDADGAVTVFSSRYARNIIHTATAAMGGADGLVAWAKRTPDNEKDFWTKIFPKTVTKEIELSDKRSIEDVIDQLDSGTAFAAPAEVANYAEFEVAETIREAGLSAGDDFYD